MGPVPGMEGRGKWPVTGYRGLKDLDVGSKEFDIRDEYKGQDDGMAEWAVGEAT